MQVPEKVQTFDQLNAAGAVACLYHAAWPFQGQGLRGGLEERGGIAEGL